MIDPIQTSMAERRRQQPLTLPAPESLIGKEL